MVQFYHLQSRGPRDKSCVQELTAMWSDLAVKQLKNGAVVEALDVLGDQASALILTLTLPQADTRAVSILHLHHGIDYGFGPLPAQHLPAVDAADRRTFLHIFFEHLLDGAGHGDL